MSECRRCGMILDSNSMFCSSCQDVVKSELKTTGTSLMNFLKDFSICAKIVDIEIKDNLASYEIQLGPGVRLQKITSLKNDLYLHFGTQSIQIKPVWEKSAVAVIIPLRSIPSVEPQENYLPKDDPLLQKAIECVVDAGQVSASLVQRRLRIGYSRATILIDRMEQLGVIGPHMENNQPRAILIKRYK